MRCGWHGAWFDLLALWFESFFELHSYACTATQRTTQSAHEGGRERACAGAWARMRTSSVLSSCSTRALCESALGMAIIE